MANLKRMMFTDEDSQQKVSLADLLDNYADKQTEKQQKMLNDTLDSKLQPVMQKIEKVEKRMEANDAKVDKRMDASDARMDAFETKLTEVQAAATASVDAAAVANASMSIKFIPSFVDIKNFCEFSERKIKGITRDQAEDLIKKLAAKLPESIKPKIGELELFGTKVHKFRVHVSAPGAVEVALIFKEALKDDESLHFNERIQYTVAERTEENEKRYQAAGKALAYLRAKAKVGDVTADSECTWPPEWKLIVTSKAGATEVGAVQSDATIGWSAEGLNKLFGMGMEETQRGLAAFRQA